MTYEDLKAYVSAGDSNDAFVIDCFEEATTLVEAFVGTQVIPASALRRAILEVGSELYYRKDAPSGIAQYSQFESAPIRVARDPMVGAYPILSRFMVTGI